MKTTNFTFGTDIFTYKWTPKEAKPLKGVVQIAHGMSEHAGRYSGFARALTDAAYIVYANDHRGHGKTAGSIENIGYFADENGFDIVVEDMHQLTSIIKNEHPDLPLYLFGHSMGSFLSRSYISKYGDELKGVILSGTSGNPGLLGRVGLLIAMWESHKKGRRARSQFLTNISSSNFNKRFKPITTNFDWLSRDGAEVDKFIADPLCGNVFTAGFYVDMLTGLNKIHKTSNLRKIPKDLPIYLFSGSFDPVGNFTKGVKQVYDAYQKIGIKDVSVKFYAGGRHEMLNEINRNEVYRDVIHWMDERNQSN